MLLREGSMSIRTYTIIFFTCYFFTVVSIQLLYKSGFAGFYCIHFFLLHTKAVLEVDTRVGIFYKFWLILLTCLGVSNKSDLATLFRPAKLQHE